MKKDYIEINKESYDKVYEDGWGNRYADSNLISIYYNIIRPLLNKKLQLKCLDFGCSLGANTRFFQEVGFEVYGIDVSPIAIQKCIEINGFPSDHFISGNVLQDENSALTKLFPDTKFDLIIAANVLYYLTDYDIKQVLGQFEDVMSDDGVFYANIHTSNSAYYKDKKKDDSTGLFVVEETGSIDTVLCANTADSREAVERLFDVFEKRAILYSKVETIPPKYTEGYHYIGVKRQR